MSSRRPPIAPTLAGMHNGQDKVAMLSVAIAKKSEIVLPEQQALEKLWCDSRMAA